MRCVVYLIGNDGYPVKHKSESYHRRSEIVTHNGTSKV